MSADREATDAPQNVPSGSDQGNSRVTSSVPPTGVPAYGADLFTDEAILDPYTHYKQLRDLGPAVWLESHDVLALPRYAEVREALANDAALCSGRGVGFHNPPTDAEEDDADVPSTIFSDGSWHDKIRSVVGRGVTPRALRTLRGRIDQIAEEIVDDALRLEEVDGVPVMAERMPLTVIPEVVGWDRTYGEDLLSWSSASFDAAGPPNDRHLAAVPLMDKLFEFAAARTEPGSFAAGSAGDLVVRAVAEGELAPATFPPLLDLLTPAIDTTASALGAAISLFATHPEQWDLVRAEPQRIPNAFNEVVRWHSPARMFTRVSTRAVRVGEAEIPPDVRVAVMFSSANRDERAWHRPDEFDINRDATEQLGFGYGLHGCLGQGLARMEALALLSVLARRVRRIEPTGPATVKPNNIIRSFGSVPVRLIPA